MALNTSGAISLAGPTAGQSIAVELGVSATATISLNDTNVRTLAGVPSGVIVMPTDFYGKSSYTSTYKGIIAYGRFAGATSRTNSQNLISSAGVVSANSTGVGSSRRGPAAGGYGGDKGIFAYGETPLSVNTRNLVSNTGVVSADQAGAGVGREGASYVMYGGDKGVIAFGDGANPIPAINTINYVTNTGVVGGDNATTIAIRRDAVGVTYGTDKGLFTLGTPLAAAPASPLNPAVNYVSNTGVVAADTPMIGLLRRSAAAAGYGASGIIVGGNNPTVPGTGQFAINLVSSTGVIASDTPAAPGVSGRTDWAACCIGGDKAVFFGGNSPTTSFLANSNLVSNTGVMASDVVVAAAGTGRSVAGGTGFSFTP